MNEHSLHSPLVYDLYRKIIRPSRKMKGDPAIEKLRAEMMKSHLPIEIQDMGTGAGRSTSRTLNQVASRSVSPVRKSVILQMLIEYFEFTNVMELGTSLGINSLYMSQGKDVKLTTFEGSDALSDIAEQNFSKMNRNNIRLIRGDIDHTLQNFLDRSGDFDLIYFDANHAYRPTLNYYTLCRDRAHDESVFVFDDIYYNKEMQKAWFEIQDKVEVTVSMDFFHIGIAIFDPSIRKQRFVLEY